jgi:hypothetical protein
MACLIGLLASLSAKRFGAIMPPIGEREIVFTGIVP